MTSARLEYEAFEAFREDPSRFITDAVNEYVRTAPTNWSLPFQHPFFSAPVAIAFGDGDAQEFRDVKKRFPWTLTPRECLESPPPVQVSTVSGASKSRVDMPAAAHRPLIQQDGRITWPNGEPPLPPWSEMPRAEVEMGAIGGSYGGPPPGWAPPPGGPPGGRRAPRAEHVTCIAIGLPLHPDTLAAESSYPWGNSPELKVHSLVGAHLGLTMDVSLYLVKMLQMFGCYAISPSHTTWGSEFMMDFQHEGPTSRQPISPCPEREWAYAAGLGTYGLSDMLITEKGMAVILTSVMTSVAIPPSPRPTQEHCLFFRDRSCVACVPRCPGQAIDPGMQPPGRLAAKCDAGSVAASIYNSTYEHARMLGEIGTYGDMSGNLIWEGAGMKLPLLSFPACGRCYTDVPCSTRIPE